MDTQRDYLTVQVNAIPALQGSSVNESYLHLGPGQFKQDESLALAPCLAVKKAHPWF